MLRGHERRHITIPTSSPSRVGPAIGAGAACLIVAIVLATVLASCFESKPEVRNLTAVGVVTRVEPLAARTVAYLLTSGDRVELDLATADMTPDGGAGEGMLLMTGTENAGRTWLIALYPNTAADVPAGCFQLVATGMGVGDSIDLSIGVRLPKAPDFDPGPVSDERYTLERAAFCINAAGEVMSYG